MEQKDLPITKRHDTFAFTSYLFREHTTVQKLLSVSGFKVLTPCGLWTLLMRNNKDNSKCFRALYVEGFSWICVWNLKAHMYITDTCIYMHTCIERSISNDFKDLQLTLFYFHSELCWFHRIKTASLWLKGILRHFLKLVLEKAVLMEWQVALKS